MTRRRRRCEEALAIARPALGSDHQLVAIYTINLASVQLARNRARGGRGAAPGGAADPGRAPGLVPSRRRTIPEDDWSVAATKSLLGASLVAQRRYARPRPCCSRRAATWTRSRTRQRATSRRRIAGLVQLYDGVGQARRCRGLPRAACLVTHVHSTPASLLPPATVIVRSAYACRLVTRDSDSSNGARLPVSA